MTGRALHKRPDSKSRCSEETQDSSNILRAEMRGYRNRSVSLRLRLDRIYSTQLILNASGAKLPFS